MEINEIWEKEQNELKLKLFNFDYNNWIAKKNRWTTLEVLI